MSAGASLREATTMNQGSHVDRTTRLKARDTAAVGLDAQFAELMEVVFACERSWRLDDRIALAVRRRKDR